MVAEYDNFILDVTGYDTENVPDGRDLLFDWLTTNSLGESLASYHRTRTIIDQSHSRTFLAICDLI